MNSLLKSVALGLLVANAAVLASDGHVEKPDLQVPAPAMSAAMIECNLENAEVGRLLEELSDRLALLQKEVAHIDIVHQRCI